MNRATKAQVSYILHMMKLADWDPKDWDFKKMDTREASHLIWELRHELRWDLPAKERAKYGKTV